ncbi:MAG: 3-oxoacyl-ACP reductase family protein [Thermodesulfovibrionales bacterium]|jgi:3-oxoacyl-[acyl-carrier protein] reductase
MRDSLIGKIALVTGASQGIGRAIAIALAQAGADVVVNYRSHENGAKEVCKQIESHGRRSLLIQADVSLASAVSLMIETVVRELGVILILVNNAGIANSQPPEEITENDWERHIAINLKSAFLITQAVLPFMRHGGWGRIINISSAAAQMGGVVGPHYAASKAGLLGLTHFYASRFAGEGITANAIAPGPISTEMSAKIPQLRPDVIPVGRFGTVEEIAEVAVMLACNGYITGQTINVNGGRYMS